MTGRHKVWIYFAALANTVVLFLLTTWLWSLPWYAGDEKLMIWATSALKFNFRELPESEKYAFINVSYNQQLIDKNDEFGFPVGNTPITDRRKLAELFQRIGNLDDQPEYILCDVFFEQPTEHDSDLEAELIKFENLIISYHLDDDLVPIIPATYNVNRGLSDYVIGNVFEGVYKFQLFFNDSLALTPLLMHHHLAQVRSKKYGPLVKVGDWWTLNHFIMNYRILQADMENQEAGFNPINLGELLMLPDEVIMDYVGGKILVIGDFFETDIHETVFELTAGPLILLNAYLSIQNKDTKANLWFFLVVFTSFYFLSYLAIFPEDLIEKHIKKRYGNIAVLRNLSSFVSFLLILIVVSTLSFFLFNIHLNVFLLAVYLFLIEKISNFLQARISKSTRLKHASN